jgi:uracil-DNA glycosylase
MQYLAEPGWISPTGPKDSPRIAIVGEAPGEEEERVGVPFIGKAGQFLQSFLRRHGINMAECYKTNVFLERPPLNDLEHWCHSKTEVDRMWAAEGNSGKYRHPALSTKGKYLEPFRLKALDRLRMELEQVKPNIVLALGNTAAWALFGARGITKLRGSLAYASHLLPNANLKVLPTFHPAGVLRQWDLLPIWNADLQRLAREQHSPIITVPQRFIWVQPTIQDLYDFKAQYIRPGCMLGTDVETQARQITCIGFAPDPHHCLVVPFWDTNDKTGNPHYWKTHNEEVEALKFCRDLFLDRSVGHIFQNGLYDIQYIWKTWGVPILGPIEDTMLRHHAMQPELPKGLGFLGSVYSDEPSWKHMRSHKSDTEKREE